MLAITIQKILYVLGYFQVLNSQKSWNVYKMIILPRLFTKWLLHIDPVLLQVEAGPTKMIINLTCYKHIIQTIEWYVLYFYLLDFLSFYLVLVVNLNNQTSNSAFVWWCGTWNVLQFSSKYIFLSKMRRFHLLFLECLRTHLWCIVCSGYVNIVRKSNEMVCEYCL